MIQVRVENKLKAQAEELFEDLGIDTASAIRLFLKQAVMYQGFPFAIIRRRPAADDNEAPEKLSFSKENPQPSSGTDMINDMDIDF